MISLVTQTLLVFLEGASKIFRQYFHCFLLLTLIYNFLSFLLICYNVLNFILQLNHDPRVHFNILFKVIFAQRWPLEKLPRQEPQVDFRPLQPPLLSWIFFFFFFLGVIFSFCLRQEMCDIFFPSAVESDQPPSRLACASIRPAEPSHAAQSKVSAECLCF